MILIPALERIPNMIFPLVYSWIAFGIFRFSLSEKINAHIVSGGPEFGWANAIGVSILFLVITLIPVFGLAFLFPSLFDSTSTKQYGSLKHEIVFDRANISDAEVDRMASALTTSGYFDNEVQKTTDLRKTADKFILSLYCDERVRNDQSAVLLFSELRKEIQSSIKDKSIVLELVAGTPDNIIKRIE